MDTWDCDICAGLGTSSRAISECAGRRNATQQPGDARYSLASQAAVGSLHSSQRPKFSSCIRIYVNIFANILFAETPSGKEALEITHNDLTRKLKKANRKLEALNAGTTPFQCPGCRNSTLFSKEMSTLGIRIPDRRPAQEENGVNAMHLLQRHHCCDAIECFHPEGRDQAEEEG
ncbi:UNVERIFIED_CONTAM: hypothetical protein H355_016208 [Colinus virginianus]|nr:hypothetical protein H355_016208 [Colinus virginianus]